MSRQVSFHIQDPTVWEQFKEFVRLKWGKLHTVLSIEVEAAIKEYMERHLPELEGTLVRQRRIRYIEPATRTPLTSKEPSILESTFPRHSTIGKLITIVKNINPNIRNISDPEIDALITVVAGGSKTTIEGYKRMLKSFGVLIPKNNTSKHGATSYIVDHNAISEILDGTAIFRLRNAYIAYEEELNSNQDTTLDASPEQQTVEATTPDTDTDTDTLANNQ
jgi:hypothetical protein